MQLRIIYMVYRTLRKYIVPNYYGWMDEFSPELKNCPISDHILKNQNNLTKNEDIFKIWFVEPRHPLPTFCFEKMIRILLGLYIFGQ